MSKQCINERTLSVFSILLALALLLSLPFSAEAAAVKNLAAARSKYGVTAANTITAKTPAAIETALSKAGSQATASKPYIVYAPSGKYVMSKKLTLSRQMSYLSQKMILILHQKLLQTLHSFSWSKVLCMADPMMARAWPTTVCG